MGNLALEAEMARKINELVAKINSSTAALQKSINNNLYKLPPPVRKKTVSDWDKFRGKVQEFWDALTEITENQGDCSKLSSTADSWSDRIGGPVSKKAQMASAAKLSTDENWTGTASDTYRQTIPDQQNALAAVESQISRVVSESLNDLRTAIVEFRIEVVAAIIIYIAALVAALEATSTIVGIPVGVLIVLAAICELCGGIFFAMYRLRGNSSGVNTKLRNVLAAKGPYGDGHWPTATRDLKASGPPSTTSQPAPQE